MKTELVILVVDDSEVIVDRLVASLKELPAKIRILAGHNFQEGKALLEKHRCDIAIFDIHLPDKNGIELLRLVKEDDHPVKMTIMITDDPSVKFRNLCQALGADYFLAKFSDLEKIPAIVGSFE